MENLLYFCFPSYLYSSPLFHNFHFFILFPCTFLLAPHPFSSQICPLLPIVASEIVVKKNYLKETTFQGQSGCIYAHGAAPTTTVTRNTWPASYLPAAIPSLVCTRPFSLSFFFSFISFFLSFFPSFLSLSLSLSPSSMKYNVEIPHGHTLGIPMEAYDTCLRGGYLSDHEAAYCETTRLHIATEKQFRGRSGAEDLNGKMIGRDAHIRSL